MAAAAALLTLTACEQGPMSGDDGPRSEAVPLWFETVGGPSTRVDVDGTSGAGTWTAGDRIAVYVAGTGANFYQVKPVTDIGAGSPNGGKVLLSLSASQNRANFAVYPASAAVEGHVTEDDLFVTYPDTYDYSALTVTQAATYTPAPMVAINNPISTDPTVNVPALNFYHVGGVLRVTVPDVPANAFSLRFTFPAGLKLSGTFKVTDAGTDHSTLIPAGLDDHGNVITVALPALDSDGQTVTVNIPLPYGEYITSDRDYKVEIVGEQYPFMGTDGILSWNAVQRAQGMKATLPAPETLGKMAGLYFARGWLNRTSTTTVDPADMSISTGSQMQLLAYYNQDPNTIAKRFYFSWNELGKAMTGNPDFNGSTGLEEETLTIGGASYRLPTPEEWRTVLSGGRLGSTVNGNAHKYYSKVMVNLAGSDYEGEGGFMLGLLVYPDGGVFECGSVTNFNTGTESFEEISYVEFRKLTDGPAACLFLPRVGQISGNTWSQQGNSDPPYRYGYYWSSRLKDSNNAYCLFVGRDRVNYADNGGKTKFNPIRLIRIEQ